MIYIYIVIYVQTISPPISTTVEFTTANPDVPPRARIQFVEKCGVKSNYDGVGRS